MSDGDYWEKREKAKEELAGERKALSERIYKIDREIERQLREITIECGRDNAFARALADGWSILLVNGGYDLLLLRSGEGAYSFKDYTSNVILFGALSGAVEMDLVTTEFVTNEIQIYVLTTVGVDFVKRVSRGEIPFLED